jgi:hypothetical protein
MLFAEGRGFERSGQSILNCYPFSPPVPHPDIPAKAGNQLIKSSPVEKRDSGLRRNDGLVLSCIQCIFPHFCTYRTDNRNKKKYAIEYTEDEIRKVNIIKDFLPHGSAPERTQNWIRVRGKVKYASITTQPRD